MSGPNKTKPGVDKALLIKDAAKLLPEPSRRFFMRGAASLGALAMLSGCEIIDGDASENVLRVISDFNDGAQALLFNPNTLAPEYPEGMITRPFPFNAYYSQDDAPDVDGDKWQLEIGGRVDDKKSWTLAELNKLPQVSQITRHVCVEGWDYIGQWSGVNLREFFARIGADITAKYVAFHCADGYTESLDMASALHPQTMLATKYAKQPIGDPFGFPLRLRTATKLGFKNAKWLTAIEVTNTFPDTYYRKEGFNWFAGI